MEVVVRLFQKVMVPRKMVNIYEPCGGTVRWVQMLLDDPTSSAAWLKKYLTLI